MKLENVVKGQVYKMKTKEECNKILAKLNKDEDVEYMCEADLEKMYGEIVIVENIIKRKEHKLPVLAECQKCEESGYFPSQWIPSAFIKKIKGEKIYYKKSKIKGDNYEI